MRHLSRGPVVVFFILLVVACPGLRAPARADSFGAGSYIIPMDRDYQDTGMLTAFGLVDQLLRAGIPVKWCIQPGKSIGGVDFTASATDYVSNAAITNHGYRGGPFVIDSAEAPDAQPYINAWHSAHPSTIIHVASASFTATVARQLTAAPRIAVLNDGNQGIIFSYLNAAGITDETGATWSNTSPDLLTTPAVAGASAVAIDGVLFDAAGVPVYSALLSGHWAVTSLDIPQVMKEIHEFLQYPVLIFSECQAVTAMENDANSGHLVTTSGVTAAPQPATVQYSSADLTYAQIDGPLGTVGGSQPSFALSPGSQYDDATVMIRGSTTTGTGAQDIWIVSYMQGSCPIQNLQCPGSPQGKVAFLGGHQYTTTVPVSANPKTQGARLFLNSLYAGTCAGSVDQPVITMAAAEPDTVTDPQITVTLDWSNAGSGAARSLQVRDSLPAGAVFVSASPGGSYSNGVVTWDLGAIGAGATDSVSATMSLPTYGTYTNTANGSYLVGLTPRSLPVATKQTLYMMPAAVGDRGPESLSLQAAPNPAMGGRMTLRLSVPGGEEAKLVVYDLAGRQVAVQSFAGGFAGVRRVMLGDVRPLTAGIYFARLSTRARSMQIRAVVAE